MCHQMIKSQQDQSGRLNLVNSAAGPQRNQNTSSAIELVIAEKMATEKVRLFGNRQ